MNGLGGDAQVIADRLQGHLPRPCLVVRRVAIQLCESRTSAHDGESGLPRGAILLWEGAGIEDDAEDARRLGRGDEVAEPGHRELRGRGEDDAGHAHTRSRDGTENLRKLRVRVGDDGCKRVGGERSDDAVGHDRWARGQGDGHVATVGRWSEADACVASDQVDKRNVRQVLLYGARERVDASPKSPDPRALFSQAVEAVCRVGAIHGQLLVPVEQHTEQYRAVPARTPG